MLATNSFVCRRHRRHCRQPTAPPKDAASSDIPCAVAVPPLPMRPSLPTRQATTLGEYIFFYIFYLLLYSIPPARHRSRGDTIIASSTPRSGRDFHLVAVEKLDFLVDYCLFFNDHTVRFTARRRFVVNYNIIVTSCSSRPILFIWATVCFGCRSYNKIIIETNVKK